MASVITEASFITNPSEARRFMYGSGIIDEADAIYEGLCSYVSNAGIAIVKNSYASSGSGNGGTVEVDGRWRESPFVTTWGAPEIHDLFVPIERVFPNSWTRTFFRWVWWHDWANKRDTTLNWFWYEHDIQVTTPMTQHDFHPYLAFYTGGPYSASIFPPADTVWVGDTVDIPWTASFGADSTSAVTIDLDRNGGAGGYNERLLGRDWFDHVGWRWLVSDTATSNAKLRIKADDYAGNSTTAYSAPFVIYDCGQLAVTNEALSTDRPAITELDLDYYATQAHKLTLKVYRLDGSTWTLADTPYLGTQFPAGHTAVQWAIDTPHQGQYLTYRMDGACSTACGSSGPVLTDQFSVQLVIANNPPVILQGPFLSGGRTCVESDDLWIVRVAAWDEDDGASLSYRWIVAQGHVGNGLKDVVTTEPEVRYSAPLGPQGCITGGSSAATELPPYRDTIQVAVSDLHGGASSAATNFLVKCFLECPSPPPCNCGAHGDVDPPLASGGDGVVASSMSSSS